MFRCKPPGAKPRAGRYVIVGHNKIWKKRPLLVHIKKHPHNHRPVPIVRNSASTHRQDGGESLAKQL